MKTQSFFDFGDKDEVISITSNDCKPFLLNIHYLRRMPNIVFAFGLIRNGNLVGVCTYGIPASNSLCEGVSGKENRANVFELNRLVLLPECEKNKASILVSKSLSMLPRRKVIVSYADTAWGHIGYIYQATNWLYTGMTKERTDAFSNGLHSRTFRGDKNIRQTRSAKHRYVFFTGTPRDKKIMRKQLKYPVLEYPKGTSHNYDLKNPIPVQEQKIYKKQ